MTSERIDQPGEQQPKLPAGGVQGAEGKFDLGMTGSVGATEALKSYLKSSKFGSSETNWNHSGYDIKASGSTTDTTLAVSKDGKAVGEYTVKSDNTKGYQTERTLYQSGVKIMETSQPEKIPSDLGALLKTKAGKKFYHALIVGFAMKIMNDLKKHQKMFSQAQKND